MHRACERPMSYFSDFAVYLNWHELDAAKLGDVNAIESIRRRIDNMVVYHHAYPVEEGEIGVTIADLITLGIVQSVTLHANP
jgi:hypothetical protein